MAEFVHGFRLSISSAFGYESFSSGVRSCGQVPVVVLFSLLLENIPLLMSG
jgi:hypothetical protein